MRRSVALGLAMTTACGPPSWPELAQPEAEPVTLGIVPADPIAGEHVELSVPMLADGTCHAWNGTVVRPLGEQTVLVVNDVTPGACAVVDAAASGMLVALGELAEGRYVVRVAEREVPFEVLPASAPVGEPPLWWRAAHAVAVTHRVGSACRGAEDGAPGERPFRVRAPRLHHQVAAAHPEWDEAAIEAAMCTAQSVQIAAISGTELRYRHGWSSLCHRRTAIGTVRVAPDGSLRVEAPYVIDEGDVPC